LSEDEKNEQIVNARRFIKNRFPQVDFAKLGPISYSSKNLLELVVKGPREGETPLFLKDGSDLQQKALNKTFIKKAHGPRADVVITQTTEDYSNY